MVLWGCKPIAMTSWMQMEYDFRDSRDVQNERVIKHFGKEWRRMREILPAWSDPVLEILNWGAAFSEEQLVCNGIRSQKTFKTLLNVVVTLHFGNDRWRLIIGVFTARWCTLITVRTSLTSVMTTKKGQYTRQPNNGQMTALRSSTILIIFHPFMNRIATHIFPHPMMLPVIQKPKVTMCVSIQSNLQLGNRFMILHTRTTV